MPGLGKQSIAGAHVSARLHAVSGDHDHYWIWRGRSVDLAASKQVVVQILQGREQRRPFGKLFVIQEHLHMHYRIPKKNPSLFLCNLCMPSASF